MQYMTMTAFVRDDLRVELQRLLNPCDWAEELLAAAARLEQEII